jgi:hypothetical protein
MSTMIGAEGIEEPQPEVLLKYRVSIGSITKIYAPRAALAFA